MSDRTWQEWGLFIKAFSSLVVARCAVTLLPFRRIAVGLGNTNSESPNTDIGENRTEIGQTRWAIQAVSRRLPGTR